MPQSCAPPPASGSPRRVTPGRKDAQGEGQGRRASTTAGAGPLHRAGADGLQAGKPPQPLAPRRSSRHPWDQPYYSPHAFSRATLTRKHAPRSRSSWRRRRRRVPGGDGGKDQRDRYRTLLTLHRPGTHGARHFHQQRLRLRSQERDTAPPVGAERWHPIGARRRLDVRSDVASESHAEGSRSRVLGAYREARPLDCACVGLRRKVLSSRRS